MPRRFLVAAGASVLLVGATACGGDDGPSAEEQFCTAGETLQADVTALADFDVITGGTDALTERFDSIKANVAAMRDAGLEVAEDEIEALQASIDELDAALSALGGDLTIDNAGDAINAVADAAGSAAAVVAVYTDTCS